MFSVEANWIFDIHKLDCALDLVFKTMELIDDLYSTGFHPLASYCLKLYLSVKVSVYLSVSYVSHQADCSNCMTLAMPMNWMYFCEFTYK